MLYSLKRLLLMIPVMVVASIVLSACAASTSAAGGQQPVDVRVTLTDFKIESSLTTFSVGVPYHFTVTNKGSVAHQTLIMPPAPGSTSADAATKMSLAGIGGSNGIAPGTTQAFDYTFTKPYPTGQLEFACHLPGHYDAGMHLPIVVK